MLNLGNAWINLLFFFFFCSPPASTRGREVIITSSSSRQVTRMRREEGTKLCFWTRLAGLTPREFLTGYSEDTEANHKCEFISHIESNT